jgi:N-formylglutamate deformylase
MAETAPYTLHVPTRPRVPVILTSPHSGRGYSAAFLAATRLDATAIRRSEDSFVDELFTAAPDLGVPLLAAEFPRAWCDANREAWELDPGMFEDDLPAHVTTVSPRIQAGLGTIARIVGNGEPIYARKLRFAEARARIESCWMPFHDTLTRLIEETLAEFGTCLVIDCHSMPTLPNRHAVRPDIVLGDGHGTCCTPALTSFMQANLAGLGLRVRRNEPYAGGYITRHYGRPREGVQAVQVELARGLYMDEGSFSRSSQFGTLQGKMTEFLSAVIGAGALWHTRDAHFRPAAE